MRKESKEMETFTITAEPYIKFYGPSLLVDAGLCKSKNEARRLIDGGGLSLYYLNGDSYEDEPFKIKNSEEAVFVYNGTLIRAGKLRWCKIVI